VIPILISGTLEIPMVLPLVSGDVNSQVVDLDIQTPKLAPVSASASFVSPVFQVAQPSFISTDVSDVALKFSAAPIGTPIVRAGRA
jgi:hypothetical protein